MVSRGFLGVATWKVDLFKSISQSAFDMWEVAGVDGLATAQTPATGTGKHNAKGKGKAAQEGATSAVGDDVSGGFRVQGFGIFAWGTGLDQNIHGRNTCGKLKLVKDLFLHHTSHGLWLAELVYQQSTQQTQPPCAGSLTSSSVQQPHPLYSNPSAITMSCVQDVICSSPVGLVVTYNGSSPTVHVRVM